MNVALVTGSTRGIGLEVARELHKCGWAVAINGRSEKGVETAIKSFGPNVKDLVGLTFDVTNSEDMREAIKDLVAMYGSLDAVVVNAGVMSNSVIGMIDINETREMFEINSISTINLIQQSSKYMIRQKSGSIVLISSILGKHSARGGTSYGATKAAVASIAQTASKELGRFGIRVNSVSPGVISTDLIHELGSEAIDEIKRRTPLSRLGDPVDVANLVKFLIMDDSKFISGQNIGIDGGYVP